MTTKLPKTRPAKTKEGIGTGMLITLEDSVAMLHDGSFVSVPRGTCITRAISGGWDQRLGSMAGVHKIGTEGKFISYRA